jgi:A/G-specific adenine glycosylase
VWVSEIILQQTQTAQAIPYYNRFIATFPTIHHLASASEEQVLLAWQGLGYYGRARLMHQTAQCIVNHYGGMFPSNYGALLKLPGIGPYTAAAIASIAYDEPYAVVDGNVFRVLSRLYAISTDIGSAQGVAQFQRMADNLLDRKQPGRYNEALMEFGRLVCKAKGPLCMSCPFMAQCVAYQQNAVGSYPVKGYRVQVRKRYLQYFILRTQSGLYLQRRMGQDVWQGLYEFVLYEYDEAHPTVNPLGQWLDDHGLRSDGAVMEMDHRLTHQSLFIQFHLLPILDATLEEEVKPLLPEGCQLYSNEAIKSLPKPLPIKRFFEKYLWANEDS